MVGEGEQTDDLTTQGGWSKRAGARLALLALGWLCVGLGLIGIVIPGLPTTVFLIVALWAFSRSSERFHRWLYEHPRFGPPLQAWQVHRVIPLRAKVLAVAVMALSLILLSLASETALAMLLVAAIIVPVAIFIVTRPSEVPGADDTPNAP
jgi:uncharacterized protein